MAAHLRGHQLPLSTCCIYSPRLNFFPPASLVSLKQHTQHTHTHSCALGCSRAYLQVGKIFAFPLPAFDIEADLDLIIN